MKPSPEKQRYHERCVTEFRQRKARSWQPETLGGWLWVTLAGAWTAFLVSLPLIVAGLLIVLLSACTIHLKPADVAADSPCAGVDVSISVPRDTTN